MKQRHTLAKIGTLKFYQGRAASGVPSQGRAPLASGFGSPVGVVGGRFNVCEAYSGTYNE